MIRTALTLIYILGFSIASTLPSKAVNKDQHVVLITVDGFPSFLWHNPILQLPNLRKLAAEGVSAKAMTVSNPSLTWINHTTLVTGVEPRKHGVLFNGLLIREDGGKPPFIEQWVHRDRMVFAPTLYDLAHQAGLTTAESDWVAITDAPTVNWSFAELPKPDSTIVKEMLAAGAATQEEIDWMQPGKRKNIIFCDAMWTRAAIFMMETHKPNLLLYHTLNTDALHHHYGPDTGPGYTALEYADRLIGDLIAAIDRAGIRDKTTIVVTSDHGFKKVNHVVQPNVVLKNAGLAEGPDSKIERCEAYCVAQGGMAFIYVTDPAMRAELLPKLKELLSKTKGVAQVIDGEDGPKWGMPLPSENRGMGDLVLFAADGYAFRGSLTNNEVIVPATVPATNYGGTHGYPNTDPDLDAIFIAAGRGIRKGVVLDRMSNLDVAPTLAKLMGLEFPEVDGRVLTEILEP